MRRHLLYLGLSVLLVLAARGEVHGFGFGGFRAGGFRAGGYGGYRYGGYRYGDFAGDRFDYGGYRRVDTGWDSRGAFAGGSYDRTLYGSRGGSITAEGARGAAVGPSGFAAGGRREVTATGPEGRTYTAGRRVGVAGGAGGVVAGGTRGFATDSGLARYSSFRVGGVGGTTLWSHRYLTTTGGYVRGGFGYYHAFWPGWYTAHPLAWTAAGWGTGAAWAAATWPSLVGFVRIPAPPIYYDYGSTVVYQGGNVYVNGTDAGSTTQYTQQAVNLATQGQQAQAPKTAKWESLGVFALVQGDEKTSNTIFQLAVNDAGTLRGTYYDGLTDTTKPVYGSVDKKTQRAAWSIGKDKNTVFDTGFYNLTKDETPVLVHLSGGQTQQWMLVRVPQPEGGKEPSKRTASSSTPEAVKQSSAQVTVLVPANAQLSFDGEPTAEPGTKRHFVTPPLTVGRNYSYKLRATWVQDGNTVQEDRTVLVTGGAKVTVDFVKP